MISSSYPVPTDSVKRKRKICFTKMQIFLSAFSIRQNFSANVRHFCQSYTKNGENLFLAGGPPLSADDPADVLLRLPQLKFQFRRGHAHRPVPQNDHLLQPVGGGHPNPVLPFWCVRLRKSCSCCRRTHGSIPAMGRALLSVMRRKTIRSAYKA